MICNFLRLGHLVRRLQVLFLTAFAILIPAVASANGGNSIAGAPVLPLGRMVSGAKAGIDYWRVPIVSGDTLRIDYEPVAMREQIELCLLAPSVTDFTINDTQCFDWKSTDQSDRKRQTVHEFALPGRYTLLVGNDYCLQGRADTKCTRQMAYNLTAYVVHRTTTTLISVPKVVRKGSLVTVRGQVHGAERGNVVLQERIGKRWVSKQLAKLSGAGRFAFKIRAAKAGTFRYLVRFPGDASHKSSKRGFTLTVV